MNLPSGLYFITQKAEGWAGMAKRRRRGKEIDDSGTPHIPDPWTRGTRLSGHASE